MFGIGMTELVVILVIGLLVLGPKRLPELARSLGKGLAEFRRASTDLRREFIDVADEARIDRAPAKPKAEQQAEAKPKAEQQAEGMPQAEQQAGVDADAEPHEKTDPQVARSGPESGAPTPKNPQDPATTASTEEKPAESSRG
jgi:Tat protein translocase TatB subunit